MYHNDNSIVITDEMKIDYHKRRLDFVQYNKKHRCGMITLSEESKKDLLEILEKHKCDFYNTRVSVLNDYLPNDVSTLTVQYIDHNVHNRIVEYNIITEERNKGNIYYKPMLFMD